MGEAELVIETKDNAVTAVIRSEKADVLDMIRKETASLERHLRDAGIDLQVAVYSLNNKVRMIIKMTMQKNNNICSF